MALISKLTQLVSGVARNVDISTNTLVVDNLRAFLGNANYMTFAGTLTADRTITMPDANVNLTDVNNAILKNGSRTFTADQPMGGFKLTGLAAGSAAGNSVRYEQVILADGTNAFSANQSMGSNKLTSLAFGTAATDAIRKDQAVSRADNSSAFDAQSVKITNLADPTLAQDAATRAFVLAQVSGGGQVKISAADTTSEYLDDSITAGAGLSKSITNPGVNEQLDLAVNVDNSSIEINADALRVKAAGITNAMLAGSIDATKIADGSVTSTEFQYINTLSSNAQTQLTNNATAISDHLADAADAHDASAISSVAAGNLVATDVQAALNELDSEKVAKSGDTMSGNLAMGGNKVTGLAAATANGEAVRYEELQSALGSIQSFEWQASVLDYIVDNTVAPPTEVSGNRYLLSHDGGAPHADWDGAEAGDIVQFNGTIWVETDPTIGMMVSVDDETTSLRQWSGTAWTQKFFESTTASTGLVKVGFDVRLDASSAGAGLGFSAGVLSANVDDSTIEVNADTLRVKALGITNSHISASAAIAYSKLALSNSIVNADVAAGAAIAYSKLNLSASIVDADIASGAAIAYSKLSLALSIVNADISASAAIAYSKLALTNSIVNADVAAGAAIAYSKLALSASIVNADISASAAIAYSKLNLSASIVNADIASGAAIAYSKLALSNSIVAGDLTTDSVTTAKIQNAAVDADKLAASVAGAGLTGGAGSALAVGANADGSIVVNADDIQVASAPMARKTMVAGESFAADTSFLVRWAISGETAGRVYKADQDATTLDKFYAFGIALSVAGAIAGGDITVIRLGTHTLGASDSAFAGADIGKPVFLAASGAFTLTAPTTTNYAVVRIGMVENTTKIDVAPQVMYIA